MHTARTSIENNERMETVSKDRMLDTVSADNWEPWSANKCSEKYVLV